MTVVSKVNRSKDVLAVGALSKALHIGQMIREARQRGLDPVAAAVKASDGWLLFEGEITDTQIADEQSYTFGLGTHTLKGLRGFEGHSFKIIRIFLQFLDLRLLTIRDNQSYLLNPCSIRYRVLFPFRYK